MITHLLPYDEETARAITREGKRVVIKLIRKLSRRYDWMEIT
jgi:hypothetical protein